LLFVSKRRRHFWNTKSKSFSDWILIGTNDDAPPPEFLGDLVLEAILQELVDDLGIVAAEPMGMPNTTISTKARFAVTTIIIISIIIILFYN
jgi:hypothetical protein